MSGVPSGEGPLSSSGELGGMESLFWADSIRSCGRLLRGEEVGGTDGDAVAEPNPRVEIMGAGPAWHGVREDGGGGIWLSWSFYPSW